MAINRIIESFFDDKIEEEKPLDLPILDRLVPNSAAPNRPDSPDLEKPEAFLPIQIRGKSVNDITMEFQMTIQPKVKLRPKAAALLLTCATIEAVLEGCEVTKYLAIHYLLELNKTYLRGMNINRDATKRAIVLAETYLLMVKPQGWIGFTERVRATPEQQGDFLTLELCPTKDIWKSWTAYYKPERWLELKIVPLEQFQERSSNTSRYSGYTKGYGESGKGYSRDGMVYGVGITKFDPEIDEDREAAPPDFSSPIDEDPEYVALSTAIQRAKAKNLEKH